MLPLLNKHAQHIKTQMIHIPLCTVFSFAMARYLCEKYTYNLAQNQ